MTDRRPQKPLSMRQARLIKLLLLLSIVVALNVFGNWLAEQVNFQLFPRHDRLLNILVLGALCLYIGLMATPFMPGIEVGLALMMLLGSKGALVVYLSTLIALSLSFMLGRLLPARVLRQFLNWLYLQRASALVSQLEPLNQAQRLALLQQKLPATVASLLSRYRYLTIAALLNLPGNALIGGGGGIALVVGMSRMIPFHGFLLLLAIATAPVPLGFFLFGD